MGMRVVFKTDMLANTGPLNDYIERELGGFDVNDPRLWEVYQAGLAEFFTNMPYVDGLKIRIGEAGTVYNKPGWDYFDAGGDHRRFRAHHAHQVHTDCRRL